MARQRDYSDWTNGSGYMDGTAGAALNKVMRQSERPRRVTQVWRAPEEQRNPIIEAMMSGIEPERKENTMITAQVERITPEVAAEYLKHNTENFRKPTKSAIDRYARDIKAGKWQVNGEPITFSKSGVLKDGQNRLMAIVKANEPAEILVVRGVADDVVVYDVGQKRSTAQVAGLSRSAAAVANAVCSGGKDKMTAPVGAVREYAEKHREELNRCVAIAQSGTGYSVGCITAKKPIMLGIYILLRMDANEDDLREFIRVTNTGFGLDSWESSAAVAFANYIRKSFIEKRQYNVPEAVAEAVQITITAFRDFAKGEKKTMAYRRPKDTSAAKKYISWLRHEDGLE